MIAEKVAPFQHPRMATVKIAHDPNARSLNDLSREELRQEIMRDLEQLAPYLTTDGWSLTVTRHAVEDQQAGGAPSR